MARVHYVASSRTDHNCKAGHIISAPAPYSWAAPGFRSPKRYACPAHPFRPSELTQGAVSSVLAAQESVDDAIGRLGVGVHDDLTEMAQEFLDAVEELASDREEALSAWENGNSQLEELRDMADQARDAFESYQPDEYPGDEDEDGPVAPDGTERTPADEYAEWWELETASLSAAMEEAVANL